MIAYDLFTWSDVQSAIQAAEATWPPGFYSARAYWDELVIEHAASAREEVERWLVELFGPRWQWNDAATWIRLESAPGQPARMLSVRMEAVDDEHAPHGRARRSFAQPDTAMRRDRWWSSLPPLPVPIVAFHSFKGGVGRTTAALHLARLVTERQDSMTLLVDMDFEAPGITWMAQDSRLPSPSIAMSDVLALFHGTPASRRHEIIELVVHKLKNATLGRVFILPAMRRHQPALDVRPEHLESARDETLADILASVAEGLEAKSVIVDLRAGHSELAASLLLDPRVSRALVTTSSGQSVRGTKETLAALTAEPTAAFPVRDEDPALTVVVSRLTPPHGDTLARVKAEILESVEGGALVSGGSSLPLRFTANLHDEGLLSLPLGWDEASSRIAASSTLELGGLSVDLTFAHWSEELVPSAMPPGSDLDEKRDALARFAENLIHAEGSGPGPFLDANFIRKLIGGHRRELPRVVAIGAKGAGKTFTFLRMVGHVRWREFATAARVTTEVDARIVPVVWPLNLREGAKDLIDESMGGSGEADRRSSEFLELRDAAKQSHTTSTQWRDWWLDRLTSAAGMSARTKLAAHDGLPALFVIDGLEDVLPDVKHDDAEQKCLRALLQEVPAWLNAASSSCGLIVFVRKDYVAAAIPQNTEQFRAAHQAYDLRWDRHEALRLVQWVVEQAGVVPRREQLSDTLLRLWGRKLGRDGSREAITENWVLDALSTRQDELQARDLVRLLAEAAARSRDRVEWEDRLLAPQAIRDALETVGQMKIREIVEEEPRLGAALERFRVLAASLRVPFTPADLPTDEDRLALVRLEDAGIAWRDGTQIWLISLYRRGLGIQMQPARRERVLR